MKFKLELFLLLALGVYLLVLVYSYVDLKCYERKLNSDKPIFKEKIVNDEIEKIRYSFKIKEMKNCEILLLEISEDIFTLFFMVLLNLLFYFRRTNDTFVEICRILITFPQYYSFFNDENNRAVLTFLSLLSLLFVPMLFPLMIDLRFYVPAIFIYFFLLFLVRRKLFGSVKYLNRRNVFISSFLLFFPYVYFIKSIIFSVFYSTKTNIPQNLSGKGLEMAQNFYGKENVYYFLSEQVNMGTFLNFFTKTLLIFGDWSGFTESEILGCVSHEIGHGGTLECILVYLLEYLLTVFLFTLYYEIIKLYAKKIDSRFDHNEAKIFLFYFNLYFFSTIYYLSLNFFSQNMEYLVDLKAVRIAPDGDIIGGFFKMYLINDDLFYKPRFYSYFLCDHPSIYHRILNIKCK